MQAIKTTTIFTFLIITTFHFQKYPSTLLSEPLKPPDFPTPNTVPSFPVQTGSQTTCRLDLSSELFGGVNAACGRNLDRSRCCPVLAAWLFAAHARSALQINTNSSSSFPNSAGIGAGSLPVMPDDSQRCVNSLQISLRKRNIRIPQPNASCDAVLCFCGIRLHQIGSISCPAAFNLTTATARNATPTAAVRNLERSCLNSSYAGCTKCLGALEKVRWCFCELTKIPFLRVFTSNICWAKLQKYSTYLTIF